MYVPNNCLFFCSVAVRFRILSDVHQRHHQPQQRSDATAADADAADAGIQTRSSDGRAPVKQNTDVYRSERWALKCNVRSEILQRPMRAVQNDDCPMYTVH